MSQPFSSKRNTASRLPATSTDGAEGQPGGPHPLPAGEIESLLKIAYENLRQLKPAPREEEIGPGDVQYLRGESTITERLETPDIDSSLNKVEQQLAEALLDSASTSASTWSGPIVPRTERKDVESATARNTDCSHGLTLEDLANIDVDVSIELGRTEILIEEILKLREGSVVTLDKLAGDPVDIVANDRLVARGELLVIDGKFGVRLTEVL